MTSADQGWKTVDGGDPFRYHPELRHLVKSPSSSFFRDFQPSSMDQLMAEIGRKPDWRYSDEERDAMFRAALDEYRDRDLWVFAYGSLMWDPAIYFEEVRHAYTSDHQRRFILWVEGGRGTPERPSVMAALDNGPGCHGLVFRIAAERLEEELGQIWRRERIAPAYCDALLTATTREGPVTALAFVADHSSEQIRPDLSRSEQVEALATASGVLGSNLEYIDNLKEQFDALGIEDEEVDALHAAAHEYLSSHS
ncbi:MAG: gamma-glutamylcyclotransferase [Paracoccaceae bacterium]|nr:gamma-glutamylcyclotransferase [Paracoccaceae bacterium]